MIEIEDVSHSYRQTPIIKNVDLKIRRGGVTALIGPNGAGKSTLLSLIARLQPLQQGRVTVDSLNVSTTPTRDMALKLAIMRQDTHVSSRLRVEELVGFGRFPHSRGRLTDADRAMIDGALELFELRPFVGRFLDTLSGGQRQRAMVAMAYCQGTDYLLLDEPLNNLDIYYAEKLMQILREIADRENRTVVIVLHDINYAAVYADRIVAMRDGRVVADGAAAAIIQPDVLRHIYGFDMKVETFDGQQVVLPSRQPSTRLSGSTPP